MGSLVHRSVPTNTNNRSPAHTFFQDRFCSSRVKVVQYTVHPLTKLSHKKGLCMTQVDQSWGLFDHQFFNATGEDHFLESKANVLQLRK